MNGKAVKRLRLVFNKLGRTSKQEFRDLKEYYKRYGSFISIGHSQYLKEYHDAREVLK